MYHWQLKDWPNFTYDAEKLQQISIAFAQEFGVANGLTLGLSEELKQEALIEILLEEAIKTSEIEGEYLSREDVMSSIKNNLGLQLNDTSKDKRAQDIAKLLVNINQNITKPLSTQLICNWHRILMQHNRFINAGIWRIGKEPMQIISGSYGKQVVHYEAPPSHQVPTEMEGFIEWYHQWKSPMNDDISKALLKSAIVHLYFESIHPFEDGNGRIGRVLAEFTLSQTLQNPVLISISKSIEKNRKLYYEQLKNAQRSLAITEWVNYFATILLDAQQDTKNLINFTLKKAKFFDKHQEKLNERHIRVINKMLEKGIIGFEGGMTAKKYMAITKTSKATATRDLQYLYEYGILMQEGGGRSVKYVLVI